MMSGRSGARQVGGVFAEPVTHRNEGWRAGGEVWAEGRACAKALRRGDWGVVGQLQPPGGASERARWLPLASRLLGGLGSWARGRPAPR